MPDTLAAWSAARIDGLQRHLDHVLPADTPLEQAMHYAAALGGKRMRPLLLWAAGECCGAPAQPLLTAACAVELIHAYSLVHDDLPCMDNDVLRRGQPTAHVRFGEAMALLAGDALQTRAFELLGDDSALSDALQARLCRLLARAAGAMAAGQAIDLAATGQQLDLAQLTAMHARKTGALLEASVAMGVACAGPDAEAEAGAALADYAAALGLAFQVVDDLLDASASTDQLGKTAGKDAAQGKATFVALLGLDATRALAEDLLHRALVALDALPPAYVQRAAMLRALAELTVRRQH